MKNNTTQSIRICGIIMNNKHCEYSLTKIFGIGIKTAVKICKKFNIALNSYNFYNVKLSCSFEDITNYIEENFLIGNRLISFTKSFFYQQRNAFTNKYRRKLLLLTVNGQSTKSRSNSVRKHHAKLKNYIYY